GNIKIAGIPRSVNTPQEQILHRKGTLFNYFCTLYQTRYDYFYVPTDFDTIEKALSGAKATEKGLK
ncbi:MAG: hypothetical protein ACOYJ5_10370, partial [Acutalibacteraceae bacterium]